MPICQRVCGRGRDSWLRLALAALVAILFLLVPSTALADIDDDIPGLPLSIGQTVQGVVDEGTDPNDVYSIELTAGEQVQIIATDTEARKSVRVYLYAPGSVSLGSVTYDEILFFNSDDGSAYMPAVSGTYYIRVRTFDNGVPYSLRVVPGTAPHITTPDANDIPGIPMGNGSWSGVVDGITDKNDVYAITLVAGQEMTLTAARTSDKGLAQLYLYPPGYLTLGDAVYHDVVSFNTGGGERYMPAASGVYYLRVTTTWSGVSYLLTLTGAGPPPTAPLFSDITTCPYKTAIEDLARADVINGMGDGTFWPGEPVSRQQFAKMIVLSLDLPVSEADVCSFRDVDTSGPSSLYPDNYVAVAAARGITQGTGGAAFSPWANISRAQVITMIVRAAENLGRGSLSTPSLGWSGILPTGDATHGANIRKAEFSGLLAGIGLTGWDIWGNASRGEVAQMLWNLRMR